MEIAMSLVVLELSLIAYALRISERGLWRWLFVFCALLTALPLVMALLEQFSLLMLELTVIYRIIDMMPWAGHVAAGMALVYIAFKT
jgi:hypothetical protein